MSDREQIPVFLTFSPQYSSPGTSRVSYFEVAMRHGQIWASFNCKGKKRQMSVLLLSLQQISLYLTASYTRASSTFDTSENFPNNWNVSSGDFYYNLITME